MHEKQRFVYIFPKPNYSHIVIMKFTLQRLVLKQSQTKVQRCCVCALISRSIINFNHQQASLLVILMRQVFVCLMLYWSFYDCLSFMLDDTDMQMRRWQLKQPIRPLEHTGLGY